MTLTASAAAILSIGREVGFRAYDMISGNPSTSKLSRYRLPNGSPIVVQTNNKTPRLWMLASQEDGALEVLGESEHYAASRPRHHHLNQVREFRGQALVKVSVSTTSWTTIKAALEAAGRANLRLRP
jgi:hypothetical protein